MVSLSNHEPFGSLVLRQAQDERSKATRIMSLAAGPFWIALLLLIGVPIFGFLRDLVDATVTQASFLVWNNPIAAGPLDLVLWLLMFYAGYFVFRRLVPERKSEAIGA